MSIPLPPKMPTQPHQYSVWDPADGDEDGAMVFSTVTPRAAALLFGEQTHARDDYPAQRILCVRDAAGTLSHWTVTAEASTTFDAREVDHKHMSTELDEA